MSQSALKLLSCLAPPQAALCELIQAHLGGTPLRSSDMGAVAIAPLRFRYDSIARWTAVATPPTTSTFQCRRSRFRGRVVGSPPLMLLRRWWASAAVASEAGRAEEASVQAS